MMRLWSSSFENGAWMPERLAFGRPHAIKRMELSDNLNPHLAWSEVPEATRSLVLVCHDPDVPTAFGDINQADRTLAVNMPRMDFFHWGLADLPPTTREIGEGLFSRGVVVGGKKEDLVRFGFRQALNDYTMAFAADPAMAGQYYGYDGPCPPWNDLRIHQYHFALYAVDVPALSLPGEFTCRHLKDALQTHVIASATLVGLYSLNSTLTPRTADFLSAER